jgi:3',5'-cyclic AMP phosphodiesterase CpdA
VRTIAHLSDLHFGREDPRAVEALVVDLRELAPSLVAVSGDLTQRAKRSEFARARAFLDRVAPPKLIVPGNHDVPLLDFVRRFTAPLRRYRMYIEDDLEPVWDDDEVLAVGVTTARSLTWKEGRISYEQMERLRQRFCGAGAGRLHVIVAHHPFSAPLHSPREQVVGRAAKALAALAGCGLDLVLSGHLHREFAGDLAGQTLARSVLALHAGSAVSRRLRGEANSYNLVHVRDATLEVELRIFDGAAFVPARSSRFLRTSSGWAAIGEPPARDAPAPA